MVEIIYVQHSGINGGKELLINDAPDVVGLQIKPSHCDVFTTDTLELRASGFGLSEIFNDVEVGPRAEMMWIRIGEYRRRAFPSTRGQGALGRQWVILTLSGQPECRSSE